MNSYRLLLNRFRIFSLETVIATSDGKILNSELIDKADDLWERARDKAEDKSKDRSGSTAISFADFIPKDFQRRLTSSSSIPNDLIQPLTDYFMKLEMTETSCASLNDLNLIGNCKVSFWFSLNSFDF